MAWCLHSELHYTWGHGREHSQAWSSGIREAGHRAGRTGQEVAGAEMRGTYRVVMREWAEMVMRVQTGEVSGVGLHVNKTFSESMSQYHYHVYKHTPLCSYSLLNSLHHETTEPGARCRLAARPGPRLLRCHCSLGTQHTHTLTALTCFAGDRAGGAHLTGELRVVHYKHREYWNKIQELFRTSKCDPRKTDQLAASEISRRNRKSGEKLKATVRERKQTDKGIVCRCGEGRRRADVGR